MPGLRNLIVFGRAVTNALQDLRSVVGKETFDEWYSERQQEMREDELMRYFDARRNEILKEGSLRRVGAMMGVEHLDADYLHVVMKNPPPGAGRFFVNDQLGGAGWEVELPDGTIDKYYVALPDAINMQISDYFSDPPARRKDEQVAGTSVQALAQHYVEYLRDIVHAAKERFSP
jgi:hypothetical protein